MSESEWKVKINGLHLFRMPARNHLLITKSIFNNRKIPTLEFQEICLVCECGVNSCEGCTRREQECRDCNLVGSCCCAETHVTWHSGQVRKGIFLESVSLGWMTVEVIASIIAGLIIGKSFALLAFGGDSIIELISAYAVLSYLRNLRNGKFAESETERTERISITLLVLLIPVITFGAVYSYFSGIKPEASPLGLVVSLGAVAIMAYLWTEKKKIGREANVLPLLVDAIESATCFFMSIAVLGSLLLEYVLGIAWADYVATGIILVFVALEIRESFQEMRK